MLIAEGTQAGLFPEYRLLPGVSVDQPEGLFAPGSVIKSLLGDKTSPILYGYDQNALGVMFKNGPVFSLSVAGGRGGGGGRGGNLPPESAAATCSPWPPLHD